MKHISHWLALAVEKGELTLPDAGNGEHRVSGKERMPLRLAGRGAEAANVGKLISNHRPEQESCCGAIVEVPMIGKGFADLVGEGLARKIVFAVLAAFVFGFVAGFFSS